jgi:hypothetical protein
LARGSPERQPEGRVAAGAVEWGVVDVVDAAAVVVVVRASDVEVDPGAVEVEGATPRAVDPVPLPDLAVVPQAANATAATSAATRMPNLFITGGSLTRVLIRCLA